MSVRRWISPSLLILGLVGLAASTAAQELEWKGFKKEGKSFFQTIETDTTQELTVMDMKFKQKQKQTFLMEWTPKGEKDGKITLEQRIAGVKMDLDIGGNKINYDSTEENQPKNPMTQFFKALEKAKFTLTVNGKDLKVEKVEGLKDLVGELVKVNKSFEPLLKKILSEETVKQLADPVLGVMPPEGKIPEKKEWSSDNKLVMGPLGTYVNKTKYTYDGEDAKNKNLAKIKVDTNLTYEKPGDAEVKVGGLPITIKDGKLETKEAKGTILFDKEKGRIESSDLHVKLEGKLTVNISNMTTDVGLVQNQDVTVKTFDDNPWGKKKSKEK